MLTLCLCACIALCAGATLYHAQRLVHIYQAEGYKPRQFALHFRNARRLLALRPLLYWGIALGVTLVINVGIAVFFADPVARITAAAWCVSALAFGLLLFIDQRRRSAQPQKKPLIYTKRVIRFNFIFGAILALAGLLCVLLYAILSTGGRELIPGSAALGIAQGLYTALLYPLFRLAMAIAAPIERRIARYFIDDGKRKLARYPDLIKIGITGSYGKTSTKMILATILSEKYRVFATPQSINTPLGITRLVREELTDAYEVFIAEMGARQRGDIRELCEFIGPKYGILTSVGPQHLETFGDIEAVLATKYELVEGLPDDGAVYICDDGGILKGVYENIPIEKGLYGLDCTDGAQVMSACDIKAGPQGSSFVLRTASGESITCQTALLGRHNVLNIAGAAALAQRLGVTLEEIARGIAKIEPVEHRLQLIPAQGRIVIDDAYNSNPAGARAALDVLKLFQGRHVIITPGLVELGEAEAQENYLLGKAMAGVVDIAILVAGNAADLERGLLEQGFDPAHIIKVGKLAQATEMYAGLARKGDVVLFENDLPDHYET